MIDLEESLSLLLFSCFLSDAVFATSNSKDTPPVLVEVQYAVDDNFLHRVARYREEIASEYGVLPILLAINIHECKSHILSKTTSNKLKPFLPKLSCYPWDNQCCVLSKESISSHLEKSPLNPIVVLGSFCTEQKPSLQEHPHQHDPFIQDLYTKASDIFRNEIAMDESITGSLLHVVQNAELRYGRAINLFDDDAQNSNTRK